MGRKRKAPAGLQWRGDVLYSEIQIKGVQIRRSLHTDNPGIAKKRLEELRRDYNAEAYGGGGPRLLIDVIEAWKASMRGNSDATTWRGKVGRETYTRYCCSLLQIVDHLEGKKLAQVKALVAEIVDARSREVTTATIKRDLGALSSVMEFACARDWCESNPVLPWLRRLKERRDPLAEPREADIALMIARSRGMWPYIIEAAVRTGIRQDALIGLKRDAVNLNRGELTVIDKGNKLRAITLSADDCKFFASIPVFAGKGWLFWRTAAKRVRSGSERAATVIGDQLEDPGPVFKREMHRVERWAKDNGVDFRPFAFHHLRHKYAIEYMRRGGNIYNLQQSMGHSTVRQTEQYLKFLTPEQRLTATHGVAAERGRAVA
jgi:integrase/recombinase XerD